MTRLISPVREFIVDIQVGFRLKCGVAVSVVSLLTLPLVSFVSSLVEDPDISQIAFCVMIIDVGIICFSLTCWLWFYLSNRNKEFGLDARRSWKIGKTLNPQSIGNVENQAFERTLPYENEDLSLYESTASASSCAYSPSQHYISRDLTYDYSLPIIRPRDTNVSPQINADANTYTLYYLDGKHTLNVDNMNCSQFCSPVPLRCCFDSVKAFHDVLREPDSVKKRRTPDNQAQNSFHSPLNPSMEIGDYGHEDIKSYCGTRSCSSHRKPLEPFALRQSKNLDFQRRYTLTSEDLPKKCDLKKNTNDLVKQAKTPSMRDSGVLHRESGFARNEEISSNCGYTQNPAYSLRKRHASAPSRRSKIFEDEGQYFKTNATFCNKRSYIPNMDSPTSDIDIGPSCSQTFENAESRYLKTNANFSPNGCHIHPHVDSPTRDREMVPSGRSTTSEGAGGRYLKTNENLSSNNCSINPSWDSPTRCIEIIPPNPNLSRSGLLHALLKAISSSDTDLSEGSSCNFEMGSADSVYFLPPTRSLLSVEPSRDDLNTIFPIVRYEMMSSNNYLVHISIVCSPEEFQLFLSKQEQC